MRRVVIWVLLAWGMLLLLPLSVQGQEVGVSLQASALYDGTSKYGEWLPLVVELENSGADVRGRVQVRLSDSEQQGYAQPVELPRGARKQITLYVVPNNFSRRIEVVFVRDGSLQPLVTTEVTVRPVPNIRFVAAAITAGGDGLEALAGINFRGERQSDQAVLVPLTLATLPERPEALRTLDMLILSGVDTSTLTPRQQAALEQYVALGGTLVLGGGPEAARVLAGIPDTLRPVTLAGEASLDTLSSFQPFTGEEVRVNGPFPAARGEGEATATVRLQEGTLPLLVEREVGHGVVIWLALDPSLTPFDAWAGTEEFWLAVVGNRAFYPLDMPPDMAPRQMSNNDLFYALQNMPSLDLPSLRLLIPLLGAYILIIGPVNYFVLRRQRRLELAWVTIPVVTLLFSVGAYGLGFQLRGSDVILNQVAIAQAVPGGQGAYVRSAIGVFSPARRSYDLAVSGEVLLSHSQVNVDPFSGSPNIDTNAILVQGEPALIENLTVNQWSLQSVMAESLATEGFGIEGDLETSGGELRGSVTNRSAHTWEDVVVILGNQFVRLGTMAPGESKEVTLEAPEGINQGSPDVAWRIFENQFGQSGASRTVQVRQQLLSSVYSGSLAMERNAIAQSRAPVLIAWLTEPIHQVELEGGSRLSSVATTLLYSELPLRFGTGDISLPRGTISARVVANDGSMCYGPGLASVTPDFDEAEVQFELPNSVKNLDPSLLALYVTSDGGWFSAPKLALYNFQEDVWVDLMEPALGRNEVQQPDAFLSDTGTIRLLVQNDEGNRGGCLFFDAALEGTLAASSEGAMR